MGKIVGMGHVSTMYDSTPHLQENGGSILARVFEAQIYRGITIFLPDIVSLGFLSASWPGKFI
jgi:hypothetical protein